MKLDTWLLTLVLIASAKVEAMPPLQTSSANSPLGSPGTVWGGQHLALEVTADGANLAFDCAAGTITGAPVPDAQGKFTIKGTLVRERPGPTMRAGNPSAPAEYSGKIEGETLRLAVSVEGSAEPYGEYVLTRGQAGRVVKCR